MEEFDNNGGGVIREQLDANTTTIIKDIYNIRRKRWSTNTQPFTLAILTIEW
jgi:hypothetical protein